MADERDFIDVKIRELEQKKMQLSETI